MRRVRYIKLVCAAFLISLYNGVLAHADVEEGLLIASISPNAAYAEEPVKITVSVLEVSVKSGTMGELDNALPANDAEVLIELTNDRDELKFFLVGIGNGKYEGNATFPSSGKWSGVVMARRTGDSGSPISKDADFDINEPRKEPYYLWYIAALFIIPIIWRYNIYRKQISKKIRGGFR